MGSYEINNDASVIEQIEQIEPIANYDAKSNTIVINGRKFSYINSLDENQTQTYKSDCGKKIVEYLNIFPEHKNNNLFNPYPFDKNNKIRKIELFTIDGNDGNTVHCNWEGSTKNEKGAPIQYTKESLKFSGSVELTLEANNSNTVTPGSPFEENKEKVSFDFKLTPQISLWKSIKKSLKIFYRAITKSNKNVIYQEQQLLNFENILGSPDKIRTKILNSLHLISIDERRILHFIDKINSEYELPQNSKEKMMTKSELIQEIFKGAYTELKDNGNLFNQWDRDFTTKITRTNLSSHDAISKQYSIPARIVGTPLFGINSKKNTFIQLERHPVDWKYLPHHMVDYLMYCFTGFNIGPYGKSEYTEANPIILEKKILNKNEILHLTYPVKPTLNNRSQEYSLPDNNKNRNELFNNKSIN